MGVVLGDDQPTSTRTVATDTAASYLYVAQKAAERGDVRDALYHIDRATELLLRPEVGLEAPGIVRGEHMNYSLLGKVLAAKAERAARG